MTTRRAILEMNFVEIYFVFVLVFIALVASIAVWAAVPTSRRWPLQLVLSSLGGTCFFLLALWNYELIGRCDILVQKFLGAWQMKEIAGFIARTAYPTLYLLWAWLVGFSVTFPLVWLYHRQSLKEGSEMSPHN